MKKGFFSKTISLFLALVMVALMVPMGAIGVFAGGTDAGYSVDTQDKKITITTADGWNAVASNSASYRNYDVTLGATIDFSGKEFKVLFPVTSASISNKLVANASEAYTGTFNGNGNKIINISYTSTEALPKAVVAAALTGTVQNLVIENVEFNVAQKDSGIVAGALAGGALISNVTVKNSTITSSSTDAGIFVGGVRVGDNNRIERSTIDGSTVTSTCQTGGFVGGLSKSVTVDNCHAIGESKVIATKYGAAGMIVGKVNSGPVATIENCSTGDDIVVAYSGTAHLTDSGIDYARGLGLLVGQVGGLTDTDWGGLVAKKCTIGGTINIDKNAYVGGAVGILSSLKATNLLEEITLKETASISGFRCIGGLIGYFYANHTTNKGTVSINKCNVAGTITDKQAGGSGTAGGVVGEFTTSGSVGIINITNTAITANITDNEDNCKGLGGVIGVLGRGNVAMEASITIENCYVAPSLATNDNKKAGGVIGNCHTGADTKIKIENVILNVNTTDAKGGCGTIHNTMDATLTKNNVASTVKDGADSSIAVITADQIQKAVVCEGGFIKTVYGSVRCNLVQISNKNTADDTYLIRFIGATIFTDITEAHMAVTVTTTEGAKTFEADCTVYDVLTGYNGTGVETYTATDFGANKFVAIVIKDMPASLFEGAVISVSLTINGTTASFEGTLPLNNAA